MNWKPHTDTPAGGCQSVLVACADEDNPCGYFLLTDLYIRRGSEFLSEETDQPPDIQPFWWMPESEVLEGLPK